MALLRVRTTITGGQGTPYYNNLYFDPSGATPATTAKDAATAFWTELVGLCQTGLVGVVSGQVEQIDPGTGQITGILDGGSDDTVTFAGGTNPLPWMVQGLVRLRTNHYTAGRELRGRIFIPGMDEAASTAGLPTSTAVAIMENAAAALTDNDAGVQVYSPTHHDQADVTTTSVWGRWAVLRSRRQD